MSPLATTVWSFEPRSRFEVPNAGRECSNRSLVGRAFGSVPRVSSSNTLSDSTDVIYKPRLLNNPPRVNSVPREDEILAPDDIPLEEVLVPMTSTNLRSRPRIITASEASLHLT